MPGLVGVGGVHGSAHSRTTCAAEPGAAAAGSAAHVVLEWADPWSRQTHKFYPPEVRARVAELMRVGQLLKRHASSCPIPFDVWETYVVKHVVASAYWR